MQYAVCIVYTSDNTYGKIKFNTRRIYVDVIIVTDTLKTRIKNDLKIDITSVGIGDKVRYVDMC